MSATLIAVLAVIIVAMAFDYTNGFHDAANAIATSVSTRALTPRVALLIAAIGNFVGAHFGARVAKTVGSDIVVLPTETASLGIVFAGAPATRPRSFALAAELRHCRARIPQFRRG